METSAGAKPRFFYGYVIVAAGFLVMLASYGSLYSFGVFFKPVSAEFGWSRVETASAYSLYMVVHGIISIFAGKLGDRLNPRVVLSLTGALLGAGFILMYWLNSLWQFYICYGILVGAGMTSYVPLMSVVARWFERRRGLMSGLVVAGIGIGTVIMPPLATHLISTYGWQVSYLIIGALAICSTVSAAQFLRRSPAPTGLPAANTAMPPSHLMQGVSLSSAVRTSQFWMYSGSLFVMMFAQQTMIVHIVPHATDLGIGAVAAAGVISMIGGVSIAGRIIMGLAVDRLGSRTAVLITFVFLATAVFVLLAAYNVPLLYLFAGIFGFGYGGMVALQSPTIAELFGLRAHGVILGTSVFVSTIGGAIGPALAGSIFDNTGAYRYAFMVTAALCAAGLVMVIRLKRAKRSRVIG